MEGREGKARKSGKLGIFSAGSESLIIIVDQNKDIDIVRGCENCGLVNWRGALRNKGHI